MNVQDFHCVQVAKILQFSYLRGVIPASAGVSGTALCTDGKGIDTSTMSGAVFATKRMNTMRKRLIS
jgi:hypothetical protein